MPDPRQHHPRAYGGVEMNRITKLLYRRGDLTDTALMLTGYAMLALFLISLGGCDLFDRALKSAGANDPVGDMKAAMVTPPTAGPEPTVPEVVPEPVAYVPPPLGCEPHRNWRYMILDCQDRQIGTYE